MRKSTKAQSLGGSNILNKMKARYIFSFFALFIAFLYLLPATTENIMGGRTHLVVMASVSGAFLLFVNLFIEL